MRIKSKKKKSKYFLIKIKTLKHIYIKLLLPINRNIVKIKLKPIIGFINYK